MVVFGDQWGFVVIAGVTFFLISLIPNYFASSDPHHDISKQLVDTTFV
jgi:hypothetical protein